MNMLRPILLRNRRGALGSIDEALDTRFAEMQSLRTEYHWLESGYEGLEISLDDEEAELNNIETRFFSLLAAGTAGTARPSRTSHNPDNGEMYDPNVPDDLRGISRNGPADDAHPLWHDLVSAIADLNNAKDECDDLLRIHEQMQYDIDLKDALGQELTSEEIEFMDEYPDDEREKKEILDHCTREVARLKELCERKGAMKKHPSFRILYAIDLNVGEDMSLDELPPVPPTLAHWAFPDLLSSPDHVLRPAPLTALRELKEAALLPEDDPGRRSRLAAAQKEYGISTLIRESKEEDKSDFITRWLLHHLRTHPLAAEILYTMFVDYFRSLRLKIENIRLWQQDVLYYWWRDAAVRSSEAFFGPLTASGMSPPTGEARLVQASVPVEISPPPSVASRASSGRAGFASDAQSLIF
ncbi:hypothetical protein CTRI78_v006169 [Colletotrichum trifolii]|uniref:Uncharacterized protein n=1 Tax=Colletotrichum trifolii TaxID=5466 RepID=A0A4R8RHH9_COLTR|nr:hypothetical protein CTRI78_v006169 [Colletotrichum trifolii]